MAKSESQFTLSLTDPALRVAVIGLGYVGLPLVSALARVFDTIGFDINTERVDALRKGQDRHGILASEDFANITSLRFTAEEKDLEGCSVFIVAVPTPLDGARRPDLAPLIAASKTVGRLIGRGGVVIYESTVYPGATEDDCIPVIENTSHLTFNKDFFAGYSPERINPGDKDRSLTKIVKVTSGSTPEAAEFVDGLYRSIIAAGTYKASSIRVAEAAKVIENTQRDVNIALINELSILFSHLGLDTHEVLEAASTKWNFLPLKPGLVGGHCIGIDPYYLVHKATTSGFIPDIISTAREINDGMARKAIERLIKLMVARNIAVNGASILIVGFTFKENCHDIRNSKVIDMIRALREWNIQADVIDTWADPIDVKEKYSLTIGQELPASGVYDALILAVPHRDIIDEGAARLRKLLKPEGVFFDMKAAFPMADSDLRL